MARLVMAVAAVGLFFVGYQWGNQYQQQREARPPTLSGVMIRPPQPLPELGFQDPLGAGLTTADLHDHWSLVALGAASGASGHRAVGRMLGVYNRLADQTALRDRLRLLLIGADTAPRLARDFQRLSPAIAVLSADATTLADLRGALGAGAPMDEPADAPPTLFLIDPLARFSTLFLPTQTEAEIAADIAALDDWPGATRATPDD